ncbi:DUF1203 domain-containing protein [uncultured Litoreibacter sp.]|uniref:DUF1203 domain-containing protein n=1 Tax=uncultured Litoreibacter sp. TaxID=1392394 RepID=UPI00260249CA|nr:DUF1203 domain-containing protein [uncultured Litoreibacter sp.]
MKYQSYDQDFVRSIRAGGPDANGMPAERAFSDGEGKPCRCCLKNIPEGDAMLILAARPFEALHPYAESGPVFLCEADCTPWNDDGLPPILTTSPDYLVKAYGADDRIIYGTGAITAQGNIDGYANTLFARDDVAYIDVRSARNNCFLTRTIRDAAP